MFASLLSAVAILPLALAAPLPLSKRDFNGQATYYAVGLGACGGVNSDSEFVVALNQPQWADRSNCGKSVTISANGATAQATVVDLCPGCAHGDLDMSPVLFEVFHQKGVGRFPISWTFNDGSGGGEGQGGNSGNNNGNNGNNGGDNHSPPPQETPESSTWQEQAQTPPPEPTTSQWSTTSTTSTTPQTTSTSTPVTSSSDITTSITTSSNTTISTSTSTSASTSASKPSGIMAGASVGDDGVAVVSSSPTNDNGNLAGLNGFVTNLGRIIALGSL